MCRQHLGTSILQNMFEILLTLSDYHRANLLEPRSNFLTSRNDHTISFKIMSFLSIEIQNILWSVIRSYGAISFSLFFNRRDGRFSSKKSVFIYLFIIISQNIIWSNILLFSTFILFSFENKAVHGGHPYTTIHPIQWEDHLIKLTK